MGKQWAEALASLDDVKLEHQIQQHLQCNHYPPVPASMVKPCVEAIQLYNEGRWDDEVELPHPVSFRGFSKAPVTAIITQHHLDAWLDDDMAE